MSLENRLFVEEYDAWREACTKSYSLQEECGVTEVSDGIILPLRKRTDVVTLNGTYEGGVCDQEGKFVAGLLRDLQKPNGNYSCVRGYEVHSDIPYRAETVVFGGILFQHYGHVLADSMCRLWWFADNPDTQYKIVFLMIENQKFLCQDVFDVLGITKDRMEVITEPTRFEKIIIPDQAIHLNSGYRKDWIKVFDRIREQVTPKEFKKIYLSRTKLVKQDGINEEFFEDFYRRRGFEIIYPETLPQEEQIAVLAGADEVVCTGGTLVTQTLFCKPKVKVTVLNRADNLGNIGAYMSVFKEKKADYYFVDAHKNFLPVAWSGTNVYFYAPTIYWKNYLDTLKIPYDPAELECDIQSLTYQYLLRWAENYTAPRAYYKIRNCDAFEFVNTMNRALFQRRLSRDGFAEQDRIVKLKKKTNQLTAKNESLQDEKKNAERKTAQLAAENASLQDEKKLTQEKITKLKKKTNQLTAKNESLQEEWKTAQEKIADSQDKITGLQDRIMELQDKITALQDSKGQPTAKSEALENAEMRSAALEKTVKKLRQEIEGMRSSLSWRITKPLRAMKAWFAKFRKRRNNGQ